MAENSSTPIADLVNKVKDGSINLSELTVQNCPQLPHDDITAKELEKVYARMVDEVFKMAGFNKVDAITCFDKCVERLARGKPFSASTIGDYKGWKAVRKYVDLAVKLHRETLEAVCIPAPQLISMIVLLNIRQVRIGTDRFLSQNPLFFRLFGRYNISQWLPLAIKFYRRLRNDIFIIENDGSLGEPQIRKKTISKNEVWIVSANLSVDNPRILPTPLVDRITLLEPMINEDVAMSGLNDSSMSESGDSDSSELVTLALTTTRAEAIQKAGDLLQKLDQTGIDQASLKPQLDGWLSEPHIRVMPEEVKNELYFWCAIHSPSWCALIHSCLHDDRETWDYETSVPVGCELHTPAAGGSSFLRNLGRLAKKALRLSGSNPGEARQIMSRHRDGLKLFSLHYESDVRTDKRLKKIEDDVARIATAVEQITTSRHNSKADITEVWSLCLQHQGNIPECVRRLAASNLTAEEMQELEARQVAH
ncbi:uncharacterized protein FFUJ_05254 [Fusarium fujikuroi IMI 58289]|uniref:Uncharacterized protein n=1 Tax=Gibberella fujikuroi (strain CBS 195.34 / IMI 58289 / NRRL A-6831) TaxID=1279085 RepID=S0DLW8_GIBF5|nr:uncharacterized protein FFUJ_05254 [Fusarium fujikuroi IMI 58289]KLP22032.1 uncharacterized protein LW94_8742 [Fusarium fujikuroi]CCT63599.1 uncharacterized protein FFUJ_05254 [Fusarium fujikuroi IMI 58289]SCN98202.1 uncharacterized protein FFM5_06743 [Fusarium fujikuroi]SCO39012.1 uncharacterized protein FFMR_05482 [Fusarium fujikuroi]